MKGMQKKIAAAFLVLALICGAFAAYFMINADHPPDSVGALHNLQYGLTGLGLGAISLALLAVGAILYAIAYRRERKKRLDE